MTYEVAFAEGMSTDSTLPFLREYVRAHSFSQVAQLAEAPRLSSLFRQLAESYNEPFRSVEETELLPFVSYSGTAAELAFERAELVLHFTLY